MQFDFSSIIGIITVVQLSIFSMFLISNNRKRLLSNRLLSAFLISNSLFIVNFLLFKFKSLIYHNVPDAFFVGNIFGFLFGPLLFLYTKSLVDKSFRIRRKDLINFVLFILFSIFYLFGFHFQSYETKIRMLEKGLGLHAVFTAGGLLLNCQTLVYMVLSLLVLRNFRKEIKKYYSSVREMSLSWLELILFAFILMWLIDLYTFIFSNIFPLDIVNHQISVTASLSINFIFASVLIFKGLSQSGTFADLETEKPRQKYAKSSLTKEESHEYLDKIKRFMDDEKPFLNPSVSLNELADMLSINSRYLSQIINENLNQNFFDFVNSYRIEEAKKLLTDKKEKKTVLEVLYESGFNSKSVFNAAFKSHTGLTPTQFKKDFGS